MGRNTIAQIAPTAGASWSNNDWYEVDDFLWRNCTLAELMWLGDTAGLVLPLPDGRELSKAEVLLLLRDLPPAVMAARYHALLADRRHA